MKQYEHKPELAAFIRNDTGLFKIYDQETDWQIIGPNFERWCSKYSADKHGSLMRAAALIPQVDIDAVIYTEGF